jgi:hypothetical protein
MDINEAVAAVEKFLTKYNEDNDDWNPTEIRVLPSGDEKDAIKVWLNFGPDVAEADVDALKTRCSEALAEAHPDIDKAFTVEVRGDAM